MNDISKVLLQYIEDNKQKYGITYTNSIKAIEDLLHEIKKDYQELVKQYKVIVYNEANLLIDFQLIDAINEEDARFIYLKRNGNVITENDKIVIE